MGYYELSITQLRLFPDMPRIKLTPILTAFQDNVQKSLSIVQDAAKYKEFRKGKLRPILKRRLYSINELSFLKLFISWEVFLEQTFVRFMCGARNSNGLPLQTFVNPISIEHAHRMIRNRQRYVDWTVGNVVIERAKLFFQDGDPFYTAIGSSLSDLSEMKTIRNSIAHNSRETERAFRNLVRQKIGSNPKGMVVGRMLMTRIPPSNPDTLLEHYGNLLLSVSQLIAS